MRSSFGLVAAACAWLGSPAIGQQPDRPPAGPPPAMVTVIELAADRGEVVCEQIMAEQVPVTKFVVMENQGRVTKVPVTVVEQRTVTSLTKLQLKQCEFYSAAGKKLTDDEARKRLTPGTVILVAVGSKPTDAYLKVLRDDVVILVSSTPVVPAIPTPPPPPPDVKPLPIERNR